MPTIDETARRCDTPGCFKTAWGSRCCSECLDDRPPHARGVPTTRDRLYARHYGGEDLAVTEERAAAREPVTTPDDDWPELDAGCQVCGNDPEDGDTLCWRCRDNVNSD